MSWLVLAGSLVSATLAVDAWLEPAAPDAARPAVTRPVRSAVASEATAPATSPIRELLVLGTVRGEDGTAIAGARVRSPRARGDTVSDLSGRYQLSVPVGEPAPPLLEFSAAGYAPQEITLRPDELAFASIPLDVTLVRVARRPLVTGRLRSPRGEPIGAETVELRALEWRERHSAVSDAGGAFAFSGLRAGNVYDLVVHPRGPYADYAQRGLEIPAAGLTLEIVLEPLPTRRLTGRMVDVEGRPVPEFRLWLRDEESRKRPLEVQGDEAGRFDVEGAPLGTLSFAASSAEPAMRVDARIDEGTPLEIVLDTGGRRLEGRVLDARGEPVAGTQLRLLWVHRSSSLRSSASRSVVSDADGRFRFDGLGPGPHRLVALPDADGLRSHAIEVASNEEFAEIVLEPEPAR